MSVCHYCLVPPCSVPSCCLSWRFLSSEESPRVTQRVGTRGAQPPGRRDALLLHKFPLLSSRIPQKRVEGTCASGPGRSAMVQRLPRAVPSSWRRFPGRVESPSRGAARLSRGYRGSGVGCAWAGRCRGGQTGHQLGAGRRHPVSRIPNAVSRIARPLRGPARRFR